MKKLDSTKAISRISALIIVIAIIALAIVGGTIAESRYSTKTTSLTAPLFPPSSITSTFTSTDSTLTTITSSSTTITSSSFSSSPSSSSSSSSSYSSTTSSSSSTTESSTISSSTTSRTHTTTTTSTTTSSSSTTTATSTTTTTSSTSTGLWSSLHGVDYAWFPLGQQCCSNGPSIDFPILKSLGFNLIRLPLSWNAYEEDPTAYIGYLNLVANEADSLGLNVVYDGHTNSNTGNLPNASKTTGIGGSFFPLSLYSIYGTGNTFFYAWWTGNVTYNGQSGWDAEWNDFWEPVIHTVNSHSSTLGYEIENEPNPGGAPLSDIQSFNQFIASHLQSATSKYIVFMGPYVGMTPSSDEKVAPQGIAHLVLDAHCYISNGCGSISSDIAGVVGVGSTLGIPVWIGEWALCTPNCFPPTQNDSITLINEFVSTFKQYGLANSYWMWKCASDTSLLGSSDLLGPYPSCQTSWIATQVSQAEANY